MAINSPHQTHYTRQVKVLLSKIYGRSKLNDSVLERAISFFDHESVVATAKEVSPQKQDNLQLACVERHSHLLSICHEIIELIEGDSFDESNRKSAQLLG
ncbi:MAG: hypothetical protein JJV99_00050, partial [Colwellia sp.]|nr:hypothetical protein [Colwellia sp.]